MPISDDAPADHKDQRVLCRVLLATPGVDSARPIPLAEVEMLEPWLGAATKNNDLPVRALSMSSWKTVRRLTPDPVCGAGRNGPRCLGRGSRGLAEYVDPVVPLRRNRRNHHHLLDRNRRVCGDCFHHAQRPGRASGDRRSVTPGGYDNYAAFSSEACVPRRIEGRYWWHRLRAATP